ncbi:MAG TPA: hypothetical protein VGK26_06075 [Thermoanaerobaculia bacterium]
MDSVGRHSAGGREVAALFAGTRLGLFVIALIAVRYFPLNSYNRDHNAAFAVPVVAGDRWREPPVAADQAAPPQSKHAEPSWIRVWAHWDALWYARVAELGYAGRFDVDDLTGEHREPPATCYYPLMPLLMRGLSPILGSPLRAALVISNLSLIAALWLLVGLTRRLVGDDAAAIGAALLLVYPPGFFLSAPYAEALGLALALGVARCVVERRFWAAGSLGFLAALARPSGVFLAVLIAVEWWSAWRERPGRARLGAALAGVLPLLGLAAYLFYCWRVFGDPLAPLHCQQTGRGPLGWPPGPIRELSAGPISLMATRRSVVELVAVGLFVVLTALGFRYLPLGFATYGLVAILVPLATSLFSFSRVSMAAFPVFLTAAALLRRRPAVTLGVCAFLALLLGVFAVLFFTWNWIG